MRAFLAIQFLIIMYLAVGLAPNAAAQATNKFSPSILIDIAKGNNDLRSFRIMVVGELPLALTDPKYKVQKVAVLDSISFYKIETSIDELIEKIVLLPSVKFVDDGNRVPKEEGVVNNLDLAVNLISTSHNKFSQWNGQGLTFSLKENKPDTNDIDFAGRYLSTPLPSKIVSQHATNMATMVAGGGNSWYLGKGAAWAARISSSDFANLLPDPNSVLQQYDITVQNHSYGVGVENFYGADAGLYDAALLNTSLLHIFSSGNSGTASATTGTYANLAGFANLTGSFKMAKNIITVGATDSFNNVVMQSSKGPAHDGRVKPELVAFGVDGSSGSAALTSGVALMLQQQYKDLFGQLPENSLVKAVLINSADDRGAKEVDFANGFGSLNALHALRTIALQRFLKGNSVNNGVQTFSLTIPAGVKKLKATLVWNDPPASPNASKALINDLDLEILNIATGETWLPWVLNKFPHADSLKLPATRKRDSLNNVEQVTIENPVAGNYQLRVKGYNVNVSTQNFHIAYQFDTTDIFEWHYPLAADPVFPSTLNTLRWKSSFANATARLQYSLDKGITWQTIDPAISLSQGYHNWTAPAFNGQALVKMQLNNIDFVSDTFILTDRTKTGIGFNCPDSFLFYWNKMSGADSFKLYTLGDKYLEPFSNTVTDSFRIFQKAAFPSKYYAVAPVFGGREGVKSYTMDYTLQGVDCYIRSFLASLLNETAELRLSLGSVYNVAKITLEKKAGSQFIAIQTRLAPFALELFFTDVDLTPGINTYRIRIDLAGGGIVYTSVESIFFFGNNKFVIYPNPAPQATPISIAQLNVDAAIMQVFNATGVKVYQTNLNNLINIIPANRLSKGVHFIRILNNNKAEKTLKLVVY